MNKGPKEIDILFAIIAVREVEFWIPFIKEIKKQGKTGAFLNFHEAGDKICEKNNILYFSLHKMLDKLDENYLIDIDTIQKNLQINFKQLILHESLVTNRTNEEYFKKKITYYYCVINKILSENRIKSVIQELGGFIAPQLLFRISMLKKINHIFIEPAMYPKRLVFTLNNFFQDMYEYEKINNEFSTELKELIDKYKNQKTVVIPKKDKHFFQDMTLKRLFSTDNFKRLKRKIKHKYITGEREEYNAIAWYIIYHFIKLIRRKFNTILYSEPDYTERYVYYPFHVPLDVQLTTRCPQFFNQEELVEKICNSLPEGYNLYIKEHPAAIGGHSFFKLRKLLKTKKIKLIHPKYNSFDLIKNAACIVTVNSKVGFEAILQGKPVVVLGKTFYKNKKVTIDVEKMEDLPADILKAIDFNMDRELRNDFLAKSYNWTWPSELYDNSLENIEKFNLSLIKFLKNNRIF